MNLKSLIEDFFGFLSKKPIIYFVTFFSFLTNGLMMPLLFRLRALSGTMIPDIIPGHSAPLLTQIFSSYGAEGMALYQKVAFYDIFYPISYALFFGALVYVLWKKSDLRALAWLPVLAAVIDYLENYYLGRIVASLPNINPALASISGNLVLAKMLLIGVTMVLITAGLFKMLKSKPKK